MLWAFAIVRYCDAALMDALCRQISRLLDSTTPQGVANTVSASWRMDSRVLWTRWRALNSSSGCASVTSHTSSPSAYASAALYCVQHLTIPHPSI